MCLSWDQVENDHEDTDQNVCVFLGNLTYIEMGNGFRGNLFFFVSFPILFSLMHPVTYVIKIVCQNK